MPVYILLGIACLLNIINPRILWKLDFWRYDDDKPEPSEAYLLCSRLMSAVGLVILAVLLLK